VPVSKVFETLFGAFARFGGTVVSKSELVDRMWKVSVLLRADMRFWTHRLAAKRTQWPACRHHRSGLCAKTSGLTTGHANGQTRLFFVSLDIMGYDDQPVTTFVEAELHSARSELGVCFVVERRWRRRGIFVWPDVRQTFEHLLDSAPERKYLLFFEPHDVGRATDDSEQSEAPLTWFAESFDGEALRVSLGAFDERVVRH
jgi:hypothetical protein